MREASKRVNERLDVENQIGNPSFQGGRGTYITCSLKNKMPAAVIAKSTKHKDLTNAMKQLYLQLLLHLQVKMHMFRHEGERDWVNYFKNRPYNDSAPSHCGIRSSFEVRDTFPGYINYVLCMHLRTYAFIHSIYASMNLCVTLLYVFGPKY